MPLSVSVARSVRRIATELEEEFKNFADAPIRFVPSGKWHITVSFLGSMDDAKIHDIADAVKVAARAFEPPEIDFEKIKYMPELMPRTMNPSNGNTVQMIWLAVDHATSKRIAKIKDVLENELAARGVPFQRSMKAFSGHCTLAKFTKETERASLPQIERPAHISFSAPSLDLMESALTRSGAAYDVIQSFAFEE